MAEIIVENGTIVAGANSYVSAANARLYAADRGVELPTDNDELAVLLIKATDYLESFACKYQGSRVQGLDQPLEWPRVNVSIHGQALPANVIPQSLVSAQVQTAMALFSNSALALFPSYGPKDYVIKEKVADLEVHYANPISVGMIPKLAAVESLLAPLFGGCSEFVFRTERV